MVFLEMAEIEDSTSMVKTDHNHPPPPPCTHTHAPS